jgi:hypothetical protein
VVARSKTIFSLVVLLLLGVSSVALRQSYAQAAPILPGAPAFIDIGFGPSSLSPANQGSPIFTINDSLWIYSTLDQPLIADLVSPSNITFRATVLPSDILSLYKFTSSDELGEWTLYFTLQNGTYYSIPIFLAENPENQSPVSLSEYSIQNGEINLGFSVNAPDAYDQEGCLTSSSFNTTFSLAEPPSIGGGSISLSIDSENNSAIVAASGQASAAFSFWFELDYSYAYASSLLNETVSRNVPVARSASIFFNQTGSDTIPFPILSNLRIGRYEVRGYFDSGSGFAASETDLLYTGSGNWFWLSACAPFTINGQNFSRQVNLAENPDSWPSTLYYMYQDEGVEAFSVIPLQINLARLDFIGEPGNSELSDFTYSIANNSNIEASGSYSGSVYIIAKTYPLSVNVTPMIGSEALSPIGVVVPGPFTDTNWTIEIGKLTVLVLNNSRADVGAIVGISNSLGASVSASIPSGGNTSFDLPAGFYDISISKSGVTEVGNATVYDGNDTIVSISYSTTQFPSYYLEYLLVPLLLGLVLNVWTWVIGPRRSKLPRLE